ncbi:reverse transcriptase domain-containing protein [Tanacetum coccineum]
MAKEDEEKTAFITSQGIFCYTKMPFGLRNVGATYQRLVDKAFHKQIGRNLEVYVDDLVIKSCTENEIVRDIEETFKTLREINMKLNPKKCTFGVEEGMFLGYKVNAKGLKVCPDKVDAMLNFIVERPEEDSPDTPMEEEGELPKPWILFTDGSSCTDDSGARLILINPEGMEFTYALRFRFDATNNEAEYEALIAGLRIAEQIGVKNLQANVDSRLVANQVNKTYVAKEVNMIRYLEKLQQKQVLVKEFKENSISEVEILAVVEEEGDTWMTPLFKYLAEGTLPAEVKKGKGNKTHANYVLKEIHEGSCSMHASTRSVMAKALRTGYYWPTMRIDARTLIRACQDWQVHKPIPRNSQQKLTPITSLWPFYRWGIDITRPFLEGPGKVKFLIVAIDYFTKWIEAKPTNGLVERANHSLGEGIKARLEARSKNWIEELPPVLWAHRTMIKSSNEDTPFSLTYKTEAVIPTEIGMPTLRTAEVDLVQNNEALKINLDILKEKRDEAAIREAKSKAKMKEYYNAKVRNTCFKPGDLVYRNNDASRSEDTRKLGPKWEGPYEITEALGKGAYKLRDRDGKQLLRTWNISNLNKCYVHTM